MSAEVALGQYLDLLATLAPWGDQDALDRAWRVIESKTARYSVELPLVIGARLAGADDVVVDWLARLGHEVGVAFQLRDDVLGVMGEPEVTGKPSGDDIREGKRTVLLELAYRDADEQGRETLQSLVGSPGLAPSSSLASAQSSPVRARWTRSSS
ncbi:polyprenyl synthetase family protein [Salana multivorans]